MRRRSGWVALLAIAAVGMTGCSSLNPGSDDAATAAQKFNEAVSASSFDEACSLLSAPAVETVEDGDQGQCAGKITTYDLSAAGTPVRAQAYGRNAMVVFEEQTLFLSKYKDGWRVIAAGCTSRGERPYDCEIEGN